MEAVKVPFRKRSTEKRSPDEILTEELNKPYIFQLIKEHRSAKPVTARLGDMGGEVENPFQPFYGALNSGMAWDPHYIPKNATKPGGQRRWRFLYSYSTIWVDEQIDPEPTREDINDERNDIKFRNGHLRVFGHEKYKLQALMLNNAFEGCVRPLKNVAKEYKLLDQDKIDAAVLQQLDDAFEAEQAARKATKAEMYAVGYYFGIDLSKSDDAIRKEFINHARMKPEVFNREFTNPKNKSKYVFTLAVEDNLISRIINPGRLTLVETGAVLFDIKTEDLPEELATLCASDFTPAVKLLNKFEAVYKVELSE